MILRPDKLFSPLHQLREYVSELVQPTSSLRLVRTRLQSSLSQSQSVGLQIYRQYHAKAIPSLYHVAEREQQRLLRVIQQQFPIVKVFSSPSIVRPNYQFSFARSISQTSQQQFRTIVSSGATGTSSIAGVASSAFVGGGQTTTTAAGAAAATTAEGFTFCAGGGFFPRTPMVGYARTPFAARHFSTARSPYVTLFQQSANTTTNTNGISHISSRLFSPAGSKVYVPSANEAHARPATPSTTFEGDDHESHKPTIPSMPFGSRPSSENTNLGCMTRGKEEEQGKKEDDREVLARVAKERKRRHHHSTRRAHYDYIRHDDLSYRYTPGSQKKPVAHMRHAHWHSSHLKAPPTPPPPPLLLSPPTVVYLSFKLDGANIWDNQHGLQESQQLDASFIGSLHSVSELYRIFLAEVVTLLDILQRHGKFEIEIVDGHELRVVFPLSRQWPAEDRMAIASRWLSEIGIDPDNPCFSIEEMEQPRHEAASARNSPEKDDFGPEYVRGIQAFLDHVDQLIEIGPAFEKGRK
ncbi:hypothetical protein BX666DRAFT_466445 [Dichotomocladium elegans]|nr:hypothetical protein BX666DRAFT_466445 [Dichotomocladium elegans]